MNSPKIASEAGHWYLPDGTPFYTVPNASKPGETRPATLRDSRKVGAVPSVTTITRSAASAGLTRYLQEQIFLATSTQPRANGESDEDYKRHCFEWAAEHSAKARDKGTEIHAAIERWLSNGEVEDAMKPFITASHLALSELHPDGSEMKSEKSFASPLGYGGKVDIHGYDAKTRQPFVADFKTKANWTDADAKRGLGYDEHLMQLVAYARGLGFESARLANIFISTDEPGKFHVEEWPVDTHERGWKMFKALLDFWRAKNNV